MPRPLELLSRLLGPTLLILFFSSVFPASSQIVSGGAPAVGSNFNVQPVFANGNVSGATNINWNNGQIQTATLTGATTLTFLNPVNGATYCLSLAQDSTGSRIVTWPSTITPPPARWTSAVHGNASQTNTQCYLYDGTNYQVVSQDNNGGFSVYGLATNAGNYNRYTVDPVSNGAIVISTQCGGAGVCGDVYLGVTGFSSYHIGTNSRTDDLKVDAGGFTFVGTGPVLLPTSTATTLSGGALFKILNNSAVPTAIASTNTETFFATGNAGNKLDYSSLVGNCGAINCPQARFEIEAAGTYGINGVTDSLRLRFYLCQTSAACAGTTVLIADTGVVTPAVAGFSNQGWNARIVCNVFTAGAAGTVDCQGQPGAIFFTALTTSILDDIVNTGTATISTVTDEYVGITATWNNSSASNTITLRNLSIKAY